eukprot:15284420-Heterocapsa_arctica.AAC.1
MPSGADAPARASQPSASSSASVAGCAPEHAATASLMQRLREFGRRPKLVGGAGATHAAERNLAKQLNRARKTGHWRPTFDAELDEMSSTPATLMQRVPGLDHSPQLVPGSGVADTAERNLAQQMLRA